jgi:hypothetical protein
LHNIRIGPIRLPPAPTFVIRVRRATHDARGREFNGFGDNPNREVHINPRLIGDEADPNELRQIDHHVERITGAINTMI